MVVKKKAEYDEFIEIIKNGQPAHWIQVAQVLGVDNETISRWKKRPEAQQAIKEGINKSLSKMEEVGAKDWKMWESKLKMLGISPVDKSDLTSDGQKIEQVVIYKPEKLKIEDINDRDQA